MPSVDILWRVVDFVLYAVVLIVVILSYRGAVSPMRTSVLCNDGSLNQVAHEDTIPSWLMVVCCVLIPVLMMALVNLLYEHKGTPRCKIGRQVWTKTVGYASDLLIGLLFSFAVIQFLKNTVSKPRPHFYKTCAPNRTVLRCSETQYVEIGWTDCTNQDVSENDWKDSFKSFPSAHACIGAFAAIYMIVFLQARLRLRSRLVVPVLQLLLLLFAMLCCVSRIWDNQHTWFDVVVGAAVGLVGALLSARYLSAWFQERGASYERPSGVPLHVLAPNGGLQHRDNPHAQQLLASTG